MGADVGPVHVDESECELGVFKGRFVELAQHGLENAMFHIGPEAGINAGPGSIPGGQVPPGRAASEYPSNAVEHRPDGFGVWFRPAWRRIVGQLLYGVPLFFGQVVAAHNGISRVYPEEIVSLERKSFEKTQNRA